MPLAPRACACLLALAAAFLPVTAQAWREAGKADVRLVAGSAANDARLRAGIEIRLEPGWHTYWRYAGDAGIPPRFDWTGSENLARVEIRWPAPTRIAVEGGIQSIGYKKSVLLPLHVVPRDPAKPVMLRLRLDFGICEKICVPASAQATLRIPPGGSSSYPALDAAEARVPAQTELGAAAPPAVLSVKREKDGEPLALVEVAVSGEPFDLFAESLSDRWSPPLPKRTSFANGRARFEIPLDGGAGGNPPADRLRLTLVSGDKAVEVVAPLD